jgi:hypothetical protein
VPLLEEDVGLEASGETELIHCRLTLSKKWPNCFKTTNLLMGSAERIKGAKATDFVNVMVKMTAKRAQKPRLFVNEMGATLLESWHASMPNSALLASWPVLERRIA